MTAMTQAGLIIGTAAYMAPEQAGGKPVDKRADMWAFGVVLWEMLTDRRLFEGETVSHVLAAVLTQEPDLTPRRSSTCLCRPATPTTLTARGSVPTTARPSTSRRWDDAMIITVAS